MGTLQPQLDPNKIGESIYRQRWASLKLSPDTHGDAWRCCVRTIKLTIIFLPSSPLVVWRQTPNFNPAMLWNQTTPIGVDLLFVLAHIKRLFYQMNNNNTLATREPQPCTVYWYSGKRPDMWCKFPGLVVAVWLEMSPVRTRRLYVCRISRSGEQYTCWFRGRSGRSVESSEIRRHHYRPLRRRLHSSGNRDFRNSIGVSRASTTSGRLADELLRWRTSKEQHCFSVSVSR